MDLCVGDFLGDEIFVGAEMGFVCCVARLKAAVFRFIWYT